MIDTISGPVEAVLAKQEAASTMVGEILADLDGFMELLSRMSGSIAVESAGVGTPQFDRLVDGLQTVAESIGAVKQVLNFKGGTEIAILEAEMGSILNDLLESLTTGDSAYVRDLLSIHLPKHLEEWRTEGLPALDRFRLMPPDQPL